MVGPLSFLVLIDDLDVDCLINKYVDYTTLTEPLCVQHEPTNIIIWSFCSTSSRSGPITTTWLSTETKQKKWLWDLHPKHHTYHSFCYHIERVSSVKLLGINLDADFSWKSHAEAITSKATQRVYFLKQRPLCYAAIDSPANVAMKI